MTHEEIISDLIAHIDRLAQKQTEELEHYVYFQDEYLYVDYVITRTDRLVRSETREEPAEYDTRFSVSVEFISCDDSELTAKIEKAVNDWEF